MTLRLLITGSRSWADEDFIASVLQDIWVEYGSPTDAIMVNGKCPKGADLIGERVWRRMGLEIEPYPAEWNKYPRGAAGPIRNKQMVDTGADVCVAFMIHGSVGTSGCVKLAEKAGIPVRLYTSTWQEQHPGEVEDPAEVEKRTKREAVEMEKTRKREEREAKKAEKANLLAEAKRLQGEQGELF